MCINNTQANGPTHNASFSNSRMTLTTHGDLGLGTTNPQYRLHVQQDYGAAAASMAISHIGSSSFNEMNMMSSCSPNTNTYAEEARLSTGAASFNVNTMNSIPIPFSEVTGVATLQTRCRSTRTTT